MSSNETRCPTCGPQPGGPGSTPLNETDKNCFKCGRTDLVRPALPYTVSYGTHPNLEFDLAIAKAMESVEAFGRPTPIGWDQFGKPVYQTSTAQRALDALEADRKRKSAKLYASAYSSDGAEIEDQLRSWE